MIAALRDTYVEYVVFSGVTEKYPLWFEEELYECTFTDESRYTFWTPMDQRKPDYYEKQLVEDYSVFIRKSDGDVHVTTYEAFSDMYHVFTWEEFTKSGIAAFNEDCIEYLELTPGVLPVGYPEWFYEYFTEAVNLPQEEDVYILLGDDNQIEVDKHCVVLRNRYGEIKVISYLEEFLKYYDDNPVIGGPWIDGP